jgi:hypothetical protein
MKLRHFVCICEVNEDAEVELEFVANKQPSNVIIHDTGGCTNHLDLSAFPGHHNQIHSPCHSYHHFYSQPTPGLQQAMATNFITRRSNSSNSLAQFYKENNTNILQGQGNHDGELDFCNAFWGQGDAGYEVISARLRASGRTVDDLKGFWKER